MSPAPRHNFLCRLAATDLQTFNRFAPLGRRSTAGLCPKGGIIALLLGSSKPAMVSRPWRCGNPLVFGTGQEGSEGGVADPSSPARFKDSIRQIVDPPRRLPEPVLRNSRRDVP